MRSDEQFKRALKKALDRLKTSDRFEKEVEAPLISAGFAPETVADVVSYLKERRFVDDRRTIMNAVERRSGRRAVGREKIRSELLKRGAPEETLEEVLGELPPEENSEDLLGLLRAKYGSEAGRKGGRAARARAGRFLASRGFEIEAVEAALDAFFGSVDDDVDY